jgi:hypothetical protein
MNYINTNLDAENILAVAAPNVLKATAVGKSH